MAIELSPGTWNLDLAHSEVGFTVRRAGISKVRGQFTDAEGTLVVGESLEGSSVQAVVKWNAALEAGGVLVGDKVTINVDAAFVLPSN